MKCFNQLLMGIPASQVATLTLPTTATEVANPEPQISSMARADMAMQAMQAPLPSTNKQASSAPACNVRIRIARHVQFGCSVWAVGASEAFGAWDISQSLAMKWTEGHVWQGTLHLPPGTHRFKVRSPTATHPSDPTERTFGLVHCVMRCPPG